MPHRALAALAVVAAAVAWIGIGHPWAQQAGIVWQFEKVAAVNLAHCVPVGTLAGFEYGPDGRPVLAWREDNSCGGGPRVFWTRKDGGLWNTTEFRPDAARNAYYHQMILRPSDGAPFLVYRDGAPGNSLYTYRTNLDAKPSDGGS